ncbi:MAG: hypothetical protein JW829_08125 [Pirellulales bacterium]|nr:hypothetical protein [Pirellulales bacterium]
MNALVRYSLRFVLILPIFLLGFSSIANAETVARCGQGWLERIDGYPVLHLKGTPFEMGYQHGALMKRHCLENFDYLLNVRGKETVKLGPVEIQPRIVIDGIVATQKKFVPKDYFEEMDGLATASGIPRNDVYAGNFIPEAFHCSGFAIMNTATRDGTLYHGRVLDYAIDWRLQEHAVLIVAEPDGKIPFANVTYAGFIGSVTGLNAEHISIGEMGGGGQGHWDGVPMSFLVREVLQATSDLDTAIDVFRNNPRTCEYFYVISDGRSNRAAGLACTWETMEVIEPGSSHPRLPHPVADAVLLSAKERYEELARRVKANHGKFDAESAIRLMDRPVAMQSNLHNALFEPASTRFWVANASVTGEPAAEQTYHAFQLSELLKRKPSPEASEIPYSPKP